MPRLPTLPKGMDAAMRALASRRRTLLNRPHGARDAEARVLAAVGGAREAALSAAAAADGLSAGPQDAPPPPYVAAHARRAALLYSYEDLAAKLRAASEQAPGPAAAAETARAAAETFGALDAAASASDRWDQAVVEHRDSCMSFLLSEALDQHSSGAAELDEGDDLHHSADDAPSERDGTIWLPEALWRSWAAKHGAPEKLAEALGEACMGSGGARRLAVHAAGGEEEAARRRLQQTVQTNVLMAAVEGAVVAQAEEEVAQVQAEGSQDAAARALRSLAASQALSKGLRGPCVAAWKTTDGMSFVDTDGAATRRGR